MFHSGAGRKIRGPRAGRNGQSKIPKVDVVEPAEPLDSRAFDVFHGPLPLRLTRWTDARDPAHDHAEIRAAIARLCAGFPGEYWRRLDAERAYPTEFVQALTQAPAISPA